MTRSQRKKECVTTVSFSMAFIPNSVEIFKYFHFLILKLTHALTKNLAITTVCSFSWANTFYIRSTRERISLFNPINCPMWNILPKVKCPKAKPEVLQSDKRRRIRKARRALGKDHFHFGLQGWTILWPIRNRVLRPTKFFDLSRFSSFQVFQLWRLFSVSRKPTA